MLLAALLFLDRQNVVPWALLACAIHELGHLAAIYALGGRMGGLHLTVSGAEIIPERDTLFSYGEELLIIAAGPAFSLLAAAVAGWIASGGACEALFLFAGLNLAAGVFNLLPLWPLDGGRLLQLLLIRLLDPIRGERACQLFTAMLGTGLLALGLVLMVQTRGNPTLLLTALWILAGVGGRGRIS